MKTLVEFRSEKFPPYEGEEEEINPGLWGKRLAEYSVVKLTEHGFEPYEIIPEDWVWYAPIKNDGAKYALCCGHQYGDDDEFHVSPILDNLSTRDFSKRSMQRKN